MELADWDLHAVVRSCTSTSSAASITATTTATSPPTTMDVDFTNRNPSDLHTHQNNPSPPPSSHRRPPELAYGARSFPSFTHGELQDLCNPFISNLQFPSVSPRPKAPSPPPSLPIPSFRPLGGGLISEQMMKPQQKQQQQHMAFQQHHPEQQQAPPKRARFVFGTTATIPSSSVTTTTAVAVSSPDSAAFSISNIMPPSQSQRHHSSVFCSPVSGSGGTSTSQSQPKTKKRKNLQKKVFHVSAEGLSSDMWAWRKYGQKPIKGSPYPRGYYRCSSSKGCLARKQVERNRSDPKMFIVTYTAEHNHPMPTHRNSLAGSTRQKPTTSADGAAAGSPSTNSTGLDQPGCSSSPTARLSLSPNNTNMAETLREPKMESFEEEEDEDPGMMENVNEMEFSSDAVLGDDFFAGFGDLEVDDDSLLHDRGGDGFAAVDRFRRGGSVELELPWLVNGGSVGGGCSGQPLVADGS